jgi:hypothetical protein
MPELQRPGSEDEDEGEDMDYTGALGTRTRTAGLPRLPGFLLCCGRRATLWSVLVCARADEGGTASEGEGGSSEWEEASGGEDEAPTGAEGQQERQQQRSGAGGGGQVCMLAL